jgi:hypothetical protein
MDDTAEEGAMNVNRKYADVSQRVLNIFVDYFSVVCVLKSTYKEKLSISQPFPIEQQEFNQKELELNYIFININELFNSSVLEID